MHTYLSTKNIAFNREKLSFEDTIFILQLYDICFSSCVKSERPGVVDTASEREKQEDLTAGSQKKHKKHKKHKSKKKKKKKNRDREKEISSVFEKGTHHQLR